MIHLEYWELSKMATKIDLHNHGAICFHPSWLRFQGYGGKNLLQLWADRCFHKRIDLCAVTSEEEEIPKGTYHDRLAYLKDKCALKLPRGYETDTLGENILIIGKERRKVYFLNGQTVIVNENGEYLDHLVVGTNQVPNLKNWRETLEYCASQGLIQIAEHLGAEYHRGAGTARVEQSLDFITAIEGNAQFIIPEFLSFAPVIGKYNRGINRKAREFALSKGKPFVTSSDAHSISATGTSYIETGEQIRTDLGEHFFQDLKSIIEIKKCTPREGYHNLFCWLNWTSRFKIGIALKLSKR